MGTAGGRLGCERKSLRPTAYATRAHIQTRSWNLSSSRRTKGNWTLLQIPELKRHVVICDAESIEFACRLILLRVTRCPLIRCRLR